MSKNQLFQAVQTKDATDAAKAKEREEIQKREKEKIAKFEWDIAEAKQKGEADVKLKQAEITKLIGELEAKDVTLKSKEDEIIQLKAKLAAATTSPTGSSDDTKQIADLTEQLAAAKAAATPVQPKIDTILKAFETATTQEYDKYTLSKVEGGFHIKLKPTVSPSSS